MKVERTEIDDILVLRPQVYEDARGFFFESFNKRQFAAAVGSDPLFVQDNHSRSTRGILRGLHYQVLQAQDKLVRVSAGEVYDVAIDVRRKSPTCGRWVGVRLSADNKKQLWVPKGFAHGFYVLSEAAEVQYKTTAFYSPQHERTIKWNDPDVAIAWPFDGSPVLSEKDQQGDWLRDAELF